MTARPLNAAGTAGSGTAHRLACPVTAADPARYGTGISTNAAGTTNPPNYRTKAVNEHASVEEFTDQLGDLIGSALLNRVPSFNLASALLRATCAISAAADISINDLIDDLNHFIDEMNADQQKRLH